MLIQPQRFQELLLAWFDRHGRKHLPWQQNKTPYRVWVSEIMLQQTQVSTVLSYFERFMQKYPDLPALASAREDDVLHLWAGLGYYSRARNLLRAAKKVMEELHGEFPTTVTALKQLPGIGQSTAGAIVSIAFNQPAPILDGNVKRVLARLAGLTKPVNEKAVEASLWTLAHQLMPSKRTADYTQALMDLGATLCTRSKPKCSECPFISECSAYQEGKTASIPAKKPLRQLPIRAATFLIFKKANQVLLYKRPAKGIWGSLWSLPELAGTPDQEAITAYCYEHFHFLPANVLPLTAFRHTFSHYHLDLFPLLIEAQKFPIKAMEGNEQIWYNLNQPEPLGLPKPIQRIMSNLP